jgi:RNA polymerase sigma factor (sigma-70 family)
VPSVTNASRPPSPDSRSPSAREQQGAALRSNEEDLRRLADRHERQEFFQQILPLLDPLKDYVRRRLRIAYLELAVRTPAETTGDILGRVILMAYRDFGRKPADLSLEQWLYQLADRVLMSYIQSRKRIEMRRRSLERLSKAELRGLEEQITADADAEPWSVEDLDDAEIEQREFMPPADAGNDPETLAELSEEVDVVLQALTTLPERDRAVFELVAVEGFSEDDVSRMYKIRPDEVRQIVERVREKVRQEVAAISQGSSQQQTEQWRTGRKAS